MYDVVTLGEVMVRVAKKTNIPIATGERLFTRFGFRETLEKGAASILQPDLSIMKMVLLLTGKKIISS